MANQEPDVKTTPQVTYKVATHEELEKPYRVIIQNDDVTPMDFVILVLQMIFGLDTNRAVAIMYEAHYNGRAHVVTLPFEEAQERIYDAHSLAREVDYPLTFYLEPDE
jgi:ATP-dependent Clp protease adaptor protein ClpS